jgi:hypothetical protein
MSWVHRFMVIPAAFQSLAKGLASGLAGDSARDMWAVGLSANGSAPPTHYVSNGLIKQEFAELLGDAQATFAAIQAAGVESVTLAQIESLYSAAIILDEKVALEELGLTFVQFGEKNA